MPWQNEATRFQPGRSGNPSGRPKRTPITDALRAELRRRAPGTGHTQAQLAAVQLVHLMLAGDVSAAKLVLAYVEGLPVQPVELRLRAQAAHLATELGCDVDDLLREAERIAAGVP